MGAGTIRVDGRDYKDIGAMGSDAHAIMDEATGRYGVATSYRVGQPSRTEPLTGCVLDKALPLRELEDDSTVPAPALQGDRWGLHLGTEWVVEPRWEDLGGTGLLSGGRIVVREPGSERWSLWTIQGQELLSPSCQAIVEVEGVDSEEGGIFCAIDGRWWQVLPGGSTEAERLERFPKGKAHRLGLADPVMARTEVADLKKKGKGAEAPAQPGAPPALDRRIGILPGISLAYADGLAGLGSWLGGLAFLGSSVLLHAESGIGTDPRAWVSENPGRKRPLLDSNQRPPA